MKRILNGDAKVLNRESDIIFLGRRVPHKKRVILLELQSRLLKKVI